MTHWLLIIRARWLSFRRWLRANIFTLLVMGPIILTGFYFIIEPYLEILKAHIRTAAVNLRPPDLSPFSFALTILLIALSLSPTLKEVYSTHSADAYLDALPIRAITRFHTTLFFRLMKNLVAWAALLIALHSIAGDRTAGGDWVRMYAPLTLAAFACISLLQILAVLMLVHYRLFGAGRLMIQAGTLLALAILTKWHQLFLLPLLPLVTPAAVFNSVIGAAVSSTGPMPSALEQPWVHLILSLALYALTVQAYARWRNSDRERAREALLRRRGGRGLLAAWARRWLREPVAAQVVRDWQLTRRGFSSAVILALGFALLFQASVVFVARRYEMSPEWFSKMAQSGCALSVMSLAALAPLLLKYQLPYFWIEKSIGIPPDAIWKAKFWYARLAAVPALVLSVVVAAPISPFGVTDEVILIFKLLIIAFVVASLMGVMVFEIAPRPILGLIFSGLAALMAAGLFIFYWIGWPLWLYGYSMVMHSLSRRARTKVYFTEVEV